MKALVLIFTLLIQGIAHAEPIQAVTQTVNNLMGILKEAEPEKIPLLCSLVNADVDNSVIAETLLGNYAAHADQAGVTAFRAAVPSIIMDQFYSLLAEKAHAEYSIGGTVPKGSTKVGVKVTVDGTTFVIVVLKSNEKIVDVEWNSFSLMNMKRDEFQREFNGGPADRPVSAVVDRLAQEGVNRCAN